MARRKKRQGRRGRAPRARRTPPHPTQPEPLAPVKRLPATFRVLYEVASAADTTGEPDASRRGQFQIAVFTRGVNAVKATRLLLTESHWEFAAGIARQMFELVVNVEHLNRQPDQAEAMDRYARFGLFQSTLAVYKRALYDEKTDIRPDPSAGAILDYLVGSFPDFARKSEVGEVRWARSWSERTTRQLAEASTNPSRIEQYDQLFSEWSEQAHAAPGALAPSLWTSPVGRTLETMLTADEPKVSELATMVVLLFIELWRLLDAVPPVKETSVLGWMLDLRQEAIRYVPSRGADDPLSSG